MKTASYSLSVNIPSIEEFASTYPRYAPRVRGGERFVWDLVMTPESFARAMVVTDMGLPAVAGIAPQCREIFKGRRLEMTRFHAQLIGALVCCLMETNDYLRTHRKRAAHEPFTKGEVYRHA